MSVTFNNNSLPPLSGADRFNGGGRGENAFQQAIDRGTQACIGDGQSGNSWLGSSNDVSPSNPWGDAYPAPAKDAQLDRQILQLEKECGNNPNVQPTMPVGGYNINGMHYMKGESAVRGVPSIDREHAQIIDDWNIAANDVPENFVPDLQKFLTDAQKHFSDESKLGHAVNNPTQDMHDQVHADVLQEGSQAMADAKSGNTREAYNWLMQFPAWMSVHEPTCDTGVANAVQAAEASCQFVPEAQ